MAKKSDNKIRVRYAPSPTGHLHIGNARTAIFNYLFARSHKGTFVIRIEDTDTKRNVKGGEESQLENLKWLGVDWDEGPDIGGDYGPYRQSERKDIYQKYIQELLDKGLAYESYLTEEQLTKMREKQEANGEMPHYEYEFAGMSEEEKAAKIQDAKDAGLTPVIRIHVPKGKTYEWDDIVKGKVSIDSDTIGGDWVIQKRDGMPTYNFAVVVDDHLMEISHVLRGDDHVANTPKQLMIYEDLGWDAPRFGHMTLIINTETGKKLSKRDESILQFIEQYRALGYLPEAMFNFITLLGWSPVGEDELFNRKQFIKIFDENRLSKSPAKFDQKKLEWVNNQYVKTADASEITDLVLENLIEAKRIADDPDTNTIQWVRHLTELYMPQMSYTQQIVELSDIFFNQPDVLTDDEQAELVDDDSRKAIEDLRGKLEKLNRFTATQIMAAIQGVRADTGVKGRKLYMPARIAATRTMHGPAIAEAIELIGKEKSLSNIDKTLDQMK
ncbi:glutamate--tRNA ligase [Companilactobacillus allii]|uniref:Glutamate--tRNA ligase n=1 Tax=Companilactobacillus allii TaxID=1847728 RepID=A0A1P8PZQ1_9LACO|nr:glutamate--tRNA ligase [Companilactobacillus allii]APX71104.1 glutamate--tRNA ligase [Companilactobacillus allii]USQ68181.1 glutamate--tRNA ligase [Companilactobacillus allii]